MVNMYTILIFYVLVNRNLTTAFPQYMTEAMYRYITIVSLNL
jgi:hypothetical protein